MADMTRNSFMAGDISTVMSPHAVMNWSENWAENARILEAPSSLAITDTKIIFL